MLIALAPCLGVYYTYPIYSADIDSPQVAFSVLNLTLIGTSCNTSPSYLYGGNWAYLPNANRCALTDPITVPSGGSCVGGGQLPAGGGTKTCYQTNINECTTTWCAVNSRVAKSDCTGFVDQNGATVTKIPAGCS